MNFSALSKKIPHYHLISKIAKNKDINIWLVGGCLRDFYLYPNKKLNDFDFCVEGKTYSIAKDFSGSISSRYIILDKDNESLRVVLKKGSQQYNYDFTRIRGQDLTQDLSLRDFTINALALNLNDKRPKVIDKFNSIKDIEGGVIRATQDKVFKDDPLRILRAFSFMAKYGFKIEKKTLNLISKNKSLLKKVSGERINEELFKILSASDSYKIIKLLDRLKVIDEFLPYIDAARGLHQGDYHHLDVWGHSIETLKQFEVLYERELKKSKDIEGYLNQEMAQNRSRKQIIKLASLLHDIGKPAAKRRVKKKTIFHTHEKIGQDLADKIAKSLRLSFKEREVLKKLIFWHLRPGYLADQIKPSKRAVYRFFRDTQEEGVAAILVSLADWRATRGPLTKNIKRKRHEKIMLGLIDKYFKEKNKKPLKKIVDGYDIMKKFNLESGPLVGQILATIKEEQSLGKIANKTQAYNLAKTMLKKKRK